MLTYEQQTEKLLSKRQAVLDRIESDKAEIEKINAKLNAIQLAKLRQDSIAESDTDTAKDDDEFGQQMSFTDKSNPFED